MSADSTNTDPDISLGPGACKNAGQYALKRLEQAEEPLRPAQIAEEYDCTPGHMRAALLELRKSGQIERVDTGEYTLSDGQSASSDTDWILFAEDAGDDGEPADGSTEDAESLENSTMVTDQELQMQRNLGIGNVDKDEEDDSAQLEDDRDDRADEDEDDEIVVEIEDSDDDPDTGSGGAMPSIPVEAVVVAAIVGAGIWWFLIRPSSSDSSTQQQEQQQTGELGSGTGLIGGAA